MSPKERLQNLCDMSLSPDEITVSHSVGVTEIEWTATRVTVGIDTAGIEYCVMQLNRSTLVYRRDKSYFWLGIESRDEDVIHLVERLSDKIISAYKKKLMIS